MHWALTEFQMFHHFVSVKIRKINSTQAFTYMRYIFKMNESIAGCECRHRGFTSGSERIFHIAGLQ